MWRRYPHLCQLGQALIIAGFITVAMVVGYGWGREAAYNHFMSELREAVKTGVSEGNFEVFMQRLCEKPSI